MYDVTTNNRNSGTNDWNCENNVKNGQPCESESTSQFTPYFSFLNSAHHALCCVNLSIYYRCCCGTETLTLHQILIYIISKYGELNSHNCFYSVLLYIYLYFNGSLIFSGRKNCAWNCQSVPFIHSANRVYRTEGSGSNRVAHITIFYPIFAKHPRRRLRKCNINCPLT